jgi:hypothetical protein
MGINRITGYVIGERTLRLIMEGKVKFTGKRLRYGRYRIVKRYLVKGVVVYGCSSKGWNIVGR